MKIPTRVTTSVPLSKTPLASLSSAGATPEAFGSNIGQGLTNFATGATNYLEEEAKRKAAIENFDTQRRLTEHETDFFTKTMDETKRAAPPSGIGVRQSTEEQFDAQFSAFMTTVPERLRPEFAAKIANLRQRAIGQSFAFEKQAGDAFFKTGVSDEATKAKAAVNQTPDEFDQWVAHLNETIDKTGLSEIEKLQLKREAASSLAQVKYKAMVRTGAYSAQNLPVEGGVEVFVNKIIAAESSGDPNARNSRSSAEGLGQFLDKTWLSVLRAERPDLARGQPDEMLLALKLDPKLSREMVAAYATANARNLQQSGFAPTPGNIYLAHFLGPEGAKKVLAARDETPIQQVVGTQAYDANKNVFSKATTAGALKEWAIGKMGFGDVTLPKVQVTRGNDGYWQAPGLEYDLAGKVRAEPVSKEYVEKVMPVLAALGLGAKITSAGQQPGQGTGSHRHDVDASGHAQTADLVLTKNGKPVTPAEAPELYAKAVEELAAQGFTGIGHYSWGIHVGGGKRAVWGPDKSGASVDPRFAAAVNRGWARAGDTKRDALDTDLSYAAIPYEDRVALRADGQREAQAQINETQQQAQIAQKQAVNELYTGLMDGKAGQADIDRLRQQGVLTDYDQIAKAVKILENRDANQSLERAAAQKLMAGGIWDPTSTDDKNMLNALVGEKGKAALASADKQYFADNVLAIVERARDIPTEAVGTLMGMVRSTDQNKALFALDAFTQLQRADFRAYADRVPQEVQRDVEFYKLRRDSIPQDELMRALNGDNSQETRQAREILRKQGQDLLTKRDGNVTGLDTLVKEVINDHDTLFSSAPGLNSIGWAALGLQRDAQALWLSEYERGGNAEVATEVTKRVLKNRWGVTELGGRKVLMELPPEKAGYKPMGGDYSWIDKQVRQELNLQPGDKYELMSDEQTTQEAARFQRDPSARPPSYRFAIVDQFGVMRESFDKSGKPKRLNFVPDQAAIQTEVDRSQELSDEAANRIFARELYKAQRNVLSTGIPVPQDMLDEAAQRAKRQKEIETNKQMRRTTPKESAIGQMKTGSQRGLFSDILGGGQSRYSVDEETGNIIREGEY